jgi:hypothetical protein
MLKDVSSQVVETKLPGRGVDQVKQEYSNAAFKAGNLQYQIYTLSKELDMINDQLSTLNLEYAKLEAEKAKEQQSE